MCPVTSTAIQLDFSRMIPLYTHGCSKIKHLFSLSRVLVETKMVPLLMYHGGTPAHGHQKLGPWTSQTENRNKMPPPFQSPQNKKIWKEPLPIGTIINKQQYFQKWNTKQQWKRMSHPIVNATMFESHTSDSAPRTGRKINSMIFHIKFKTWKWNNILF